MKPARTIPVKTWQFYSACKQVLGESFLTNFFSVSPRQIRRWSCDPDFCESSQRNPSDRHEALLQKMMELGKEDIARGDVRRKARIVNCLLVEQADSEPDKATLTDEMLDDYPAVAEFHSAMRSEEDEIVIRDLLSKAKRDLDETYMAYVKHRVNNFKKSAQASS